MRKGIAGTCIGICMCLVASVVMSVEPALAQTAAEKPPLYTFVAEWVVPRAKWADYEKQQAAGNDAMKKLVADGTLVSYGSFAVLNHQEGGRRTDRGFRRARWRT